MTISIFALKGELNGKNLTGAFLFCRVYTYRFELNRNITQIIAMKHKRGHVLLEYIYRNLELKQTTAGQVRDQYHTQPPT